MHLHKQPETLFWRLVMNNQIKECILIVPVPRGLLVPVQRGLMSTVLGFLITHNELPKFMGHNRVRLIVIQMAQWINPRSIYALDWVGPSHMDAELGHVTCFGACEASATKTQTGAWRALVLWGFLSECSRKQHVRKPSLDYLPWGQKTTWRGSLAIPSVPAETQPRPSLQLKVAAHEILENSAEEGSRPTDS